MTIDILALARECGFEFYPDADGNIDDDLFTGSRHELLAFGNAIIERCAAVCDKVGESDDPDDDNCARQVRSLAFAIRRMKAPTP